MVTYHLKQRKVTKAYIIKVNLHILPSGCFIVLYELLTLTIVVDLADIKSLISCSVNTVVKFSSKQIYSHDTEDQPEYKANKKHIHDGWNSS